MSIVISGTDGKEFAKWKPDVLGRKPGTLRLTIMVFVAQSGFPAGS
jgi:hypothetical protein